MDNKIIYNKDYPSYIISIILFSLNHTTNSVIKTNLAKYNYSILLFIYSNKIFFIINIILDIFIIEILINFYIKIFQILNLNIVTIYIYF